jgi:hypothetical protein
MSKTQPTVPTKAHQSSLQISLIGRQHRPIRLHLLADRISDRDTLQFLGESAQSTTYNWFARSQQCGSLASPLWSGTQTPCVF